MDVAPFTGCALQRHRGFLESGKDGLSLRLGPRASDYLSLRLQLFFFSGLESAGFLSFVSLERVF